MAINAAAPMARPIAQVRIICGQFQFVFLDQNRTLKGLSSDAVL